MRKLLSVITMVGLGFLGAALFAAVDGNLPFHHPGSFYFKDVNPKSISNNDIGYAYEYGVVNGYGDGRYGPNNVVDRGQMATFIMRSSAYDPLTAWIVVDDQYFNGYYFGWQAWKDGCITWDEYRAFQNFLDWYFGLLDFESSGPGDPPVSLPALKEMAKNVMAREQAMGRAPQRLTAAERAAGPPAK